MAWASYGNSYFARQGSAPALLIIVSFKWERGETHLQRFPEPIS